jgi:hypothetical protein
MRPNRREPGTAVLPFETAVFTERQVALAGMRALAYQRSFLPYLSADFLRLGACRIAVRADDPSTRELRSLPEELAGRVQTVDRDGKLAARTQVFLEPVLEEIPVIFELGGLVHRGPRSEDPDVVAAVAMFRRALLHLLIGVNDRLHVDLDIPAVRERLALLDRRLQGPAARRRVAAFAAVLDGYDQMLVEGARLGSRLEKDRVRTFAEVAERPEYQQLSQELAALGVPGKAPQAVLAMRRLDQWLRRRLKGAIEVAPTALAIPVLGKQHIEEIGRWVPEAAGYFPAIMSFAEVRVEALQRFAAESRLSAMPRPVRVTLDADGNRLVFD